ncbi:MAG: leucyl aminopeptidase [Deltaproteobacteria bacterium]|nr:leucyl aminopeptidase [Candidatus Anaeroferrophillacea bacterium]
MHDMNVKETKIDWRAVTVLPAGAAGLRVYITAPERRFHAAGGRDEMRLAAAGDRQLEKPVSWLDDDLGAGACVMPLAAWPRLNVWEAVKTAAAWAADLAVELKLAEIWFVMDGPDAGGFEKKVLEGVLLGRYRYRDFKRPDNGGAPPAELRVGMVTGSGREAAATAVLARTETICRAVNRVRTLVNHPANVLGPEDLAGHCVALAGECGLAVEVWDENRLAADGYAGLPAVGRGSERPPRMVELSFRPHGDARAHVALVGKGITFDSGGLSLKPPAGMEEMKRDMAGAAAVIGAMEIIARLKPQVAVTGIVVLAENMPDAAAQRPGDIITMRNGTTVEVKNTDAEGRLVLADGLLRAVALKPDYVVDIATLTGACLVALGTRIAGVLGDRAVVDRLVASSHETGEQVWPLPLEPVYRDDLKSDAADIANVGSDRNGGTIRGALFLREFVPESLPWAHVDIAGPSFVAKPWKYFAAGATGFGARLLAGFVKNLARPDGGCRGDG